MSYERARQLRQSTIQGSLAVNQYTPTPTFGETVEAAYDETRLSSTIAAPQKMRDEYLNPLKHDIQTMINKKQVPEDIIEQFTTTSTTRNRRSTDWEALGNYLNDTYGTAFDFSEEAVLAFANESSRERQAILDAAGGASGFAAQLLGSGGAFFSNPVDAGIMLTAGAPMRFGATAMGTAAKMALREGLVNVAYESVVQAHTYSFKKRVGQEYRLSEGAVNLLAAFTFGSGVGVARTGYNYHIGNTNVADAVAANKVVIDELSARANLDPAERVILPELRRVQDYMLALSPKEQIALPARQTWERSMRDLAGQYSPGGTVSKVLAETGDLESFEGKPRAMYESVIRINDVIREYGPMERTGPGKITDEQLAGYREILTGEASQRLSRGERKQLNKELQDLQYRLNRVTEEAIPQEKKRNVSARKQKAQEAKRGAAAAAEERQGIIMRIEAIEQRLDSHAVGVAAEADLTRMDQGILPGRFRNTAPVEDVVLVEDLDLQQQYFRALMDANPDAPAGKAYNEMVTHERIESDPDIVDRNHVPPGNDRVVTADVDRSSNTKLAPEKINEAYTPPDEVMDAQALAFTDDGELTTVTVRDAVDDAYRARDDGMRKLDDASNCIYG
jgi:hypothetical protein